MRRGRARGERGGAKRRRRLAMEGEAATTTTITETVVTITETTREVSLGKVALVLILVLLLAYLATRHVLGIGNRRRITLLVGPAGSGKTTLFRQVSHGPNLYPSRRSDTNTVPSAICPRSLARSLARSLVCNPKAPERQAPRAHGDVGAGKRVRVRRVWRPPGHRRGEGSGLPRPRQAQERVRRVPRQSQANRLRHRRPRVQPKRPRKGGRKVSQSPVLYVCLSVRWFGGDRGPKALGRKKERWGGGRIGLC